ncbi:MAG: hypothetical protein J6Z22_01465 [Lachnospiraceae bacterium]|nr:hypothetical protein [Lachnospiraceae bacterium]
MIDTKNDTTFSISLSAFTYARSISFDESKSADLRNLTKALYLYGKATADYFGIE